jgi:predicted thioesterase
VLLVGVEINVKHLCAALDVKMVVPVQILTLVNVLLVGVEINVKHMYADLDVKMVAPV